MPHPSIMPKCPYYEKENQITIFCESNIRVMEEGKSGYYAHLFKNPEAKKEYMRQHCQKYPDMNCPYANYMNRFYEKLKKGTKNDEAERKTEKSKKRNQKSGKDHCGNGQKKQISVRLM